METQETNGNVNIWSHCCLSYICPYLVLHNSSTTLWDMDVFHSICAFILFFKRTIFFVPFDLSNDYWCTVASLTSVLYYQWNQSTHHITAIILYYKGRSCKSSILLDCPHEKLCLNILLITMTTMVYVDLMHTDWLPHCKHQYDCHNVFQDSSISGKLVMYLSCKQQFTCAPW